MCSDDLSIHKELLISSFSLPQSLSFPSLLSLHHVLLYPFTLLFIHPISSEWTTLLGIVKYSHDTKMVTLCTTIFLTLFKFLAGISDLFTCLFSYSPADSLQRISGYQMLIDQSRTTFKTLSMESITRNKMLTQRYFLQKASSPFCHLILFEHQKSKLGLFLSGNPNPPILILFLPYYEIIVTERMLIVKCFMELYLEQILLWTYMLIEPLWKYLKTTWDRQER